MSYPESSEVSAGQPTASAHYNNLRKDALYLGMSSLDAAALGTMLARFEEGLRLELLETDRIRVPAAADSPVYLMINGCMLAVNANVDLSAGSKPSGAAAQYYIFAVRTAGATTFTLDVNTTATPTTDQRRIGGFYWDGSAIDPGSIYTEKRAYLLENLGMQSKQVFGGRLTLSSGNPAPGTVMSSGTVFYIPYVSNRVSVYGQGMGWKEHVFTELSLSLAGAAASRPADIFLFDDAGTLTLEHESWSSASARAAALTTQDGVQVKSGEPTKVYLGTVGITSAAGVSADTPLERLVWNMYNRVLRPMGSSIGTNSWTYATGAWRAATGSVVCSLDVVAGMPHEAIQLTGSLMMVSSGAQGGVGIGSGVSNANSAQIRAQNVSTGFGVSIASLAESVTIGLKTYHLLEWGGSGITFYGSNGGAEALRSGLTAVVMM